jgi:nucleotide-binding universal stress UspA family protein
LQNRHSILEAAMTVRASVLCPIDFSEASAGALRYAAAIAIQFSTRVVVLTVEDPLLTEAVDLGTGTLWTPEACKGEMAQFAAKTFGAGAPQLASLEYDVAVGKPAPEILRLARERSCELIVISTHGLTGMRKLFFGSTTERVLRETTKAVLVTPPHDPGPVRLEDAKRLIRRILVPVDLSSASLHQTQVARQLAEGLDLPLILVHVIEPLKTRLAARLHLAGVEADRRAVAEDGLNELQATLPLRLHPEALVAYGDPAEELAKVARDRQAGLVVMGLHGSPLLGPRMGSVTYRLLCLTSSLILALPPTAVKREAAISSIGVARANDGR